MAEGEPPYSEETPLKAMMMIGRSEPPGLGKRPAYDAKITGAKHSQNPSGLWSAAFETFVEVCLIKNPVQRPGAEGMLKVFNLILLICFSLCKTFNISIHSLQRIPSKW